MKVVWLEKQYFEHNLIIYNHFTPNDKLPCFYQQPNNTIEETATLTLRCDVTEQIPLLIRAMVTSE